MDEAVNEAIVDLWYCSLLDIQHRKQFLFNIVWEWTWIWDETRALDIEQHCSSTVGIQYWYNQGTLGSEVSTMFSIVKRPKDLETEQVGHFRFEPTKRVPQCWPRAVLGTWRPWTWHIKQTFPTGEFLLTVTYQFQCGYRDMESSLRSKESNVSQRVGSPLDVAPTPKHPSNRLGIWLFCRPEFTKTSFISWFGAWFTLVPNSQLANWSRVAPVLGCWLPELDRNRMTSSCSCGCSLQSWQWKIHKYPQVTLWKINLLTLKIA